MGNNGTFCISLYVENSACFSLLWNKEEFVPHLHVSGWRLFNSWCSLNAPIAWQGTAAICSLPTIHLVTHTVVVHVIVIYRIYYSSCAIFRVLLPNYSPIKMYVWIELHVFVTPFSLIRLVQVITTSPWLNLVLFRDVTALWPHRLSPLIRCSL